MKIRSFLYLEVQKQNIKTELKSKLLKCSKLIKKKKQDIERLQFCFRSLSDIRFRQLVYKNHFIQLIYNDEDLRDCEILHQKKQIKKFLHTFKHNLSNLISTSNVTIESLDNRPFPIDTFSWFNYSRLSDNCKKLQHKMKSELSKKNNQLDKRQVITYKDAISFLLHNVNRIVSGGGGLMLPFCFLFSYF